MAIVVACLACGTETESQQRRDGKCPSCWLRSSLASEFEEYRRLWAKRLKPWANRLATEEQLTHLVMRMSRRIHAVLAQGPGTDLLNSELERIRLEVERRATKRIVAPPRGMLIAKPTSVAVTG